jgi:chromosome partitioning protein
MSKPKTPTFGPVVAVSNLKGGSGKTVLAVHLAYIMGATLLDLDPQGDAADWCRRSGLVTAHHVHGQEEVFRLIHSLQGPIVMDTPPGEGENLRMALAFANVVVIPVKPGSSDLRALGRMRDLLQAAKAVNPKLKGAVVLNEAKTVSTLSRDMETALGNLKGTTYLGHLGDRVAFPEALAAGEVVGGSSAADEVMAIADNLSKLV